MNIELKEETLIGIIRKFREKKTPPTDKQIKDELRAAFKEQFPDTGLTYNTLHFIGGKQVDEETYRKYKRDMA